MASSNVNWREANSEPNDLQLNTIPSYRAARGGEQHAGQESARQQRTDATDHRSDDHHDPGVPHNELHDPMWRRAEREPHAQFEHSLLHGERHDAEKANDCEQERNAAKYPLGWGKGWHGLGATTGRLLRPLQPTLTLATRHLGRQCIEPLAPRAAEAIEPRLHFAKGHRAELVHSARAFRA